MAAVSEIQARCVIWFGQPLPAERAALTAAGWQVRSVQPGQVNTIGLRGRDQLVGLIDFRQIPSSALATLREWLDQHRHLSLLAALPGGITAIPQIWHPLLDACDARFALPFELPALLGQLQQQQDGSQAQASVPAQRLIGTSPALLATHAALCKFAPVDLPVLITGETGTGKELAAHALHAMSARAQHPFVAVNCGAIPAYLVQSELFGHERGAFTGASQRRLGLFESAQKGTVFLDEVGDLPLDAQTSLLRVLQEGTIERVGSNQPVSVEVRVLAATHVDLEQAVAQGRFRRDLFYRLNVLRLPMPALRERSGDILLLADHFLHQFRGRHAGRARGFSTRARQALQRFDWPGNVRELLNRVQRAAIVADAELIEPADLDLVPAPPAAARALLHDARQQVERELLLRALHEHEYNVSACARHMQVSRVTVYRLCRKHQVELPAMR